LNELFGCTGNSDGVQLVEAHMACGFVHKNEE
jgi:hypothetical protein